MTLADYPEGGEAQIAETKLHGWRLVARRTRLVGKQADLFPNWQYFAFATNRTEPLLLVERGIASTPSSSSASAISKTKRSRTSPPPVAANSAWTVIAALATTSDGGPARSACPTTAPAPPRPAATGCSGSPAD